MVREDFAEWVSSDRVARNRGPRSPTGNLHYPSARPGPSFLAALPWLPACGWILARIERRRAHYADAAARGVADRRYPKRISKHSAPSPASGRRKPVARRGSDLVAGTRSSLGGTPGSTARWVSVELDAERLFEPFHGSPVAARRSSATDPCGRDLLVLCRSESQAARARTELLRFLVPAGLPLKASAKSIHILSGGESADWLGFKITKSNRRLDYSVADRGWTHLNDLLGLAHTKPDALMRAIRSVIRPWLWHRAPCYRPEVRELVCSRLLTAARSHGFEELPSLRKLFDFWAAAAVRWSGLRDRTRESYRQSGTAIARLGAPIADITPRTSCPT